MRWWALPLFVALFAGCVADEATVLPDPQLSLAQGPADVDAVVNVTPNAPPLANLTTNMTSGQSPLNVTFNVTASDADGDNLTWALLFGDEVSLVENATDNMTGNQTLGNSTTDGNGTVVGNQTGSGNLTEPAFVLDPALLTNATLPASVNHTYLVGGNYTARLFVTDGRDWANVTLLINVSGLAPPVVIFYDGAEAGTALWTIQAKVTFIDFFGEVPTQETNVDHPSGATWEISTAQFHSGTSSWFSGYEDLYRARMKSGTLTVPADGTLSFWYMGGAEANGYDGVHVMVDGTQVAHLTGAAVAWTFLSFPLAAGDHIIEFRMDADISCSSTSPPSPPGDPGGLCGAGWDAGGLYIDDITVTA